MISTLPLHLVFNGVVYSGNSGVMYDMYVVTQDFAEAEIPTSENTRWASQGTFAQPDWSRLPPLYNSLGSLSEMDTKTYAQTLDQIWISEWSAVLVILSYRNATHPLRDYYTPGDVVPHPPQYRIECGPKNNYQGGWYDTSHKDNEVANNNVCRVYFTSDERTLACYIPVSHCLVQEAERHCTLSFHVLIMIAVIVCNVVKLGCIVVMIWRRGPTPLITLRDAVASLMIQVSMAGVIIITVIVLGLPLRHVPR